jgi:hypothetical protein
LGTVTDKQNAAALVTFVYYIVQVFRARWLDRLEAEIIQDEHIQALAGGFLFKRLWGMTGGSRLLTCAIQTLQRRPDQGIGPLFLAGADSVKVGFVYHRLCGGRIRIPIGLRVYFSLTKSSGQSITA